MARVRTFLAVDVGSAIRDNAILLQAQLAKSGAAVKWVGPDALHVTLVFLGEVDERDLVKVCRAAAKAAQAEPAFSLRVAGVGAFPNPRRPKVVWCGITEGADELRRLFARMEEQFLELGVYRTEGRDYTPHLTLGRTRGEADGQALAAELPKYLAWQGGQTVVEEVLIMSSELERDGPSYAVLGRGRLGTAKE